MKVRIDNNPIEYSTALGEMQEILSQVQAGSDSTLWMLQHNPVYTAGTSAKDIDLLTPQFPVIKVGRGGKHTYHGPGQLVGYVMVDLKKYQLSIKDLIHKIESSLIDTLQIYGLRGTIKANRVGIWLDANETKPERKIAALGLRVSKGVSWHGFSLNINPNLDHFKGIVPCGLSTFEVTSLENEGKNQKFHSVANAIGEIFPKHFSGLNTKAP